MTGDLGCTRRLSTVVVIAWTLSGCGSTTDAGAEIGPRPADVNAVRESPAPAAAANARPAVVVSAEVDGGIAYVGLPLSATVRVRAADPSRPVWISAPVAVKWEPLAGVAVTKRRPDLAEGGGMMKPVLLAHGLRYSDDSWVSTDIRFRGEGSARLRCRVTLFAGWDGEEERMIEAPPIEAECELEFRVVRESAEQRRAVVESILADLRSGDWEPTRRGLARVRGLPGEDAAITAAVVRFCDDEESDFRSSALRALLDSGPLSEVGMGAVRRRVLDRHSDVAGLAFARLAEERVWLSEDECRRVVATDSWGHLLEFANYLAASEHPAARNRLEQLAVHPREVVSDRAKSLLRGLK